MQIAAKGVAQNAELCKRVVEHLELYPNSLFNMFFKQFDDKSYDLGLLQSRAFNLSGELIPALVLKRYNGSATIGARLAEFLWKSVAVGHKDFICNSTHLLMQQMKVYHKLKSFHALVLFTYLSKEAALQHGLNSECKKFVYEYTPAIVESLMFSDRKCSCCGRMLLISERCIDNAINETDTILQEQGTSDDANVTYPHQIMFLGFVLHSLIELKANSNLSIANKVISTQKKFNETYKGLYDEIMNEYFNPNNTPSNSLETLWFNKRFYLYFSKLMFRRAFAQFGLTKLSLMFVRLERILDSRKLKTKTFCECASLIYSELALSGTSEEVFSMYLYLDHYVQKKDRQYSLIDVTLCHKTHNNLINNEKIIMWREYFISTWNNLTLRPRLLQWHKTYELSSPWLLPKLVQHVMDNSRQQLMELLEFFSVLAKEAYSDPLSLCPGLFELTQQINKHPESISNKTLLEISQMIPTSRERMEGGVSNMTYSSYLDQCKSTSKLIKNLIHNKVIN
jgi:hypothetical protein